MEFLILGSTEVVAGGRHVQLPSGRARALLVLLALDAGRPIAAERLIDELWGEHPPPTAATVVQGLVSRLRKTLEPNRPKGSPAEILETLGSGYRLAIDPSAVDAHKFTRLLDEARVASPEVCHAKLSIALGLWRGPALLDFAYEPFAQRAIAALEEARREAIELLFASELDLGRDAALVGDLEAAIAAHPFRERLRGFFMVALYRAGRQTEALDAYRAARTFLLEEMGLEPGPALRELQEAILRQDPALEFKGSTSKTRSGHSSSWLPHERRQVTVVVVDVAPDADQDIDAETVTGAGSRATALAAEVLRGYGGRVESYPGERLVGFFGFPIAHEDDALRAVNAALHLRTAVLRLNDGSMPRVVRYRARTGLETGEVVVGPGSSLAEAVRGPVVSSADRLQHAAPDAEVLLGPGARRLLRGAVIIGRVEVPGQDTKAWRVLEVVAQAPAIPRTFDAPMIGRQSELTRLRSAFRRSRHKGVVVPVTIVGDAGIGKSRLAREVIASLGDDAFAITLRCPPPGDAMGFYPLRQAVVEAAGIHGWGGLHDLLAQAYDGTHAVPVVADTIGLRSPPAGAVELLTPLRLLFELVARQRPLVVVLEDLHWADSGFRGATDALAREASGPILLLCLARPDAFEGRPGWGEMVTLEPLNSGDIARLTTERAGRLAEASLRRIVALSHGNPLFAEQLAASLDDGDLDTIPASLVGLLSMRLDRLGPGERDLLRVAAIAGVDIEVGVVEALLPTGARPFLDRYLETLERKRLIERIDPHTFRFAHPLIQMATYQSMTRDDRDSLHQALTAQVDHAPAKIPTSVVD
jgi:DNA-binding SARP family transcriptional activator